MPASPSHLGIRGSGLRRRLSGRRWWRWFFILAIFAGLHDLGFFPGLGNGAAPLSSSVIAAPNDETETVSENEAAEDSHAETSSSTDDAAMGHDPEAHEEESAPGGHSDPVAPVLLGIMLILLAAKLGGDVFERMSMPAVLGELSVGVLLGNMVFLTGWHGLDFLQPRTGPGTTLDILARIGVVLLLFEVGLESRISEMLSVGTSSVLVALLGVIAPIILGWAASWAIVRPEGASHFDVGGDWVTYLFPPGHWQVHAFIGATLCATSVGITARVLKDLGRAQQKESRIILGAAVIDDVLGLIVLAIVTGVIMQGEVSIAGLMKTVGLAFGFLAVAVILGALNFPRTLFRAASYLRGHGLLVVTALVICFGFAYGANMVGLAPIIGAFAAGLILEGAHYQEAGRKWENYDLEEALAPLTAVLVPIFFVEMGIQVDLQSFTDPSVWILAATITIVAIIGKQVCSLGVREKGLNKIAVGLGMIPRGEVGLIFANEGRHLVEDGQPVISPGTYSAVVVMVIITTMVTPPLLKWSLDRSSKNGPAPDAEQL